MQSVHEVLKEWSAALYQILELSCICLKALIYMVGILILLVVLLDYIIQE